MAKGGMGGKLPQQGAKASLFLDIGGRIW